MSALTAAQMLRRGDLPHPGEHVVIHPPGGTAPHPLPPPDTQPESETPNMPASTRPSTAELLRRGDLPHPGEHVVIHLTGTDNGCKVVVDTNDGRTDWAVEKSDGFYRANPADGAGVRSAGRFGNLLGILVRVARGDD